MLTACSPQKRLNRIIRNHPELADTTFVATTVYDKDTFVVEGDTIEKNISVFFRDTVFTSGRLTLRSKAGRISAFVPTDTFVQTDTMKIEVPVRIVRVEKEPLNTTVVVVAAVSSLLLLITFIRTRR